MNNKNWFNENIETYEVSVWHKVWIKCSNWFIDTLLLVLIVITLALIWDII